MRHAGRSDFGARQLEVKPLKFSVARPEQSHAAGRGPILLLCDHASNFIPENFDALGLTQDDMNSHFA
jgi:predicted N-formylglutamate amidohydrolase